jgi:hypothetical protein
MLTRTIYTITLLAVLTSCGNNATLESDSVRGMANNEASYKTAAFDADASSPIITERKLIKTGDLSFETNDVAKTKVAVEAICKGLNAYISNENQNNYGERRQYQQTIRVPANQFDALLQKIEAEAVNIENKNINTQDVTEEFIDVEARLNTKKELEARYREILKQAKTVQDIVTIESQIANVRSEIESMEGRLTYLKNQVSFSTLHVSYFEIIGTDFGFANKFIRGLGQGWDNLLAFLIVLANLWPFFILIGAIALGVTRWKKHKRKQSIS